MQGQEGGQALTTNSVPAHVPISSPCSSPRPCCLSPLWHPQLHPSLSLILLWDVRLKGLWSVWVCSPGSADAGKTGGWGDRRQGNVKESTSHYYTPTTDILKEELGLIRMVGNSTIAVCYSLQCICLISYSWGKIRKEMDNLILIHSQT